MKRIVIIRLVLAVPVLLLSILYLNWIVHQDDWKKITTPLPKETIDLLCSNFRLLPDDSLCSGKKDVYAVDFVDIAEDTFRPYELYRIKSSEAATYDDVEKKIGRFKYKCEPIVHQADGLTYFSCSYDLQGDQKFVMTILYTSPEWAVMRIMSTSTIYDY